MTQSTPPTSAEIKATLNTTVDHDAIDKIFSEDVFARGSDTDDEFRKRIKNELARSD
jgi:hypothetical protein